MLRFINPPPDDFRLRIAVVFPEKDRTAWSLRHLSVQRLTNEMSAARFTTLKQAGLPRIRVHDLRHSCATIRLAAGEHPKVVQEVLGHQSVQITLDLYSHLMPELGLKERAAARLDAVLAPPENCGQNCGQMEEDALLPISARHFLES